MVGLLSSSLSAAERICHRDTFIVAVDIGHTRKAGGATSARGIAEYEFNNRMARLVVNRLTAAGYPNVLLINDDGTVRDLRKRTAEANAVPVNLLLSIHHDSVQPHYLSSWEYHGKKLDYSDHFHGYSIFVSRKNGASDRSILFAGHLGEALRAAEFTPTLHHAEQIPGENREMLDTRQGIYLFDALTVLKTAEVPAVLLECGVIKHREEETALNDEKYRQRMADAIVTAIDNFCADECPADR